VRNKRVEELLRVLEEAKYSLSRFNKLDVEEDDSHPARTFYERTLFDRFAYQHVLSNVAKELPEDFILNVLREHVPKGEIRDDSEK